MITTTNTMIKIKRSFNVEIECDPNISQSTLQNLFNAASNNTNNNHYASFEEINKQIPDNPQPQPKPDQKILKNLKIIKEKIPDDVVNSLITNYKNEIRNKEPIDDVLHCVCMMSNPCNFKKRKQLALEFMKRMSYEPNIALYIVELAYDNQEFSITDKNNPRHLQLRTKIPVWCKENCLNIGIKKLFPLSWRFGATIDMDIEFENPNWSSDALKVLNNPEPTVAQLFSHSLDMNQEENPMTIFQSFCYQMYLKKPYGQTANHTYCFPGLTLAFNREAFDKMGGLYDKSILGSGDYNMMLAFIGKADITVNKQLVGYHKSVIDYQKNIKNFKITFVSGTVRHYFHGSKVNRKYVERNTILIENMYDPNKHMTYDSQGIIIPTKECPQKLLDGIMAYFKERNEDEA